MDTSKEIADALFDYLETYTEDWEVYSDYMIMKYVVNNLYKFSHNAIKIRLDSKKTKDYKIEFPIQKFKYCEEYFFPKPSLCKKFLSLFVSKYRIEIKRWKFIDSFFRRLQNEHVQIKLNETLKTIKSYKTGESCDREESN